MHTKIYNFSAYFLVIKTNFEDSLRCHSKKTAWLLKNKKPTRCHVLFYCTSYRLNLFRALLCPSSGARDYDVDYHIGRFVLGLLYVGGKMRVGWSSVRTAARTLLKPNCT